MTTTDTSVLPIPGLSDRAKTPRVLRLHPDDNLIVSIDPILPGAIAEGVTAVSRVPKGHKMATVEIAEGAPVKKFGQIIGFAKMPIRPASTSEHNCGVHDRPRLHFAEGASRACARGRAPHVRGLPPQAARSARATTSASSPA
jgi:altronate hydrolase